jgi:hypothetical protein
MKSTYYSAAWTDSGCLLSCGHEHETLVEAASCIPCARGYVVGIENGVMRSLRTEEESEFQSVIPFQQEASGVYPGTSSSISGTGKPRFRVRGNDQN